MSQRALSLILNSMHIRNAPFWTRGSDSDTAGLGHGRKAGIGTTIQRSSGVNNLIAGLTPRTLGPDSVLAYSIDHCREDILCRARELFSRHHSFDLRSTVVSDSCADRVSLL